MIEERNPSSFERLLLYKVADSEAPPEPLSIVIPAYNEQARLPALFDALAREAAGAAGAAGMDLLEVLVVDDGSSDRTPELLAAAAAEDPQLKPVRAYEANRGKGAAFAAGVERAQGGYVLLADVDLFDPAGRALQAEPGVCAGAPTSRSARAPCRAPWSSAGQGTARCSATASMPPSGCSPDCACATRRTASSSPNHPDPAAARRADLPRLLLRRRAARRAPTAPAWKIAEVPILYEHDKRSSVRVGSAGAEMLRDVIGLAYRLRRK